MAIARLSQSAERIVYRIAGFPLAASALLLSLRSEELDPLQGAFAWKYWHPDGVSDWTELLVGLRHLAAGARPSLSLVHMAKRNGDPPPGWQRASAGRCWTK